MGFRRDDMRLVPLLVGHPDRRTGGDIYKILAPYWADEQTFFIISSDFCHWSVLLPPDYLSS